MEKSVGHRRKRKFIRHDLQLKVVFITLFVASLVLLVNFQLCFAALWSLTNSVTTGSDIVQVCDEMRQAIVNKFLISVGMAIPLAAAIGILFSFRFCGPIYKFKKYLTELPSGNWNQPCFLRKGDDLQDICDAINGAVSGFQEFLRENREILQETHELMVQGSLSESPEAGDRVKALQERIEKAFAVFEEHMPVAPSSGGSPVENTSDANQPEEAQALQSQA